ncbi:hypothetical protein [Bartonella sp. HY038]|uniref:hypothetical protein n=1 Tax=Bartonella sp. HY038 TaxID=2759660 RepID=UPI0015F87D1A|nr:hypothetical protein [Bartonella sp. HY038]
MNIIFKIAFITFLSFSLVNVNMAFSQNVNKTDLIGKCFYQIIKDSEDVYLDPLCFEEKIFKIPRYVNSLLPDGSQEHGYFYMYWHDWFIKDNQLFFRKPNNNGAGSCVITLEKEILTFVRCENEWATLRGRWRQGEVKNDL